MITAYYIGLACGDFKIILSGLQLIKFMHD